MYSGYSGHSKYSRYSGYSTFSRYSDILVWWAIHNFPVTEENFWYSGFHVLYSGYSSLNGTLVVFWLAWRFQCSRSAIHTLPRNGGYSWTIIAFWLWCPLLRYWHFQIGGGEPVKVEDLERTFLLWHILEHMKSCQIYSQVSSLKSTIRRKEAEQDKIPKEDFSWYTPC